MTAGIIGLVNKGQRRKPDDWGSLRAWAWGASRGLDYLETDKTVDAKKVGIEGVSRYGKAALVTMAYDQRFAVVLVGSSGEGGAKLHRRNFGEAVENLTGSGEYHWMAGNFLKYGTAESTFGSKNAGDIPVDAHQLIALCAPRLTFISYGVPERGDAEMARSARQLHGGGRGAAGVPAARRQGPRRLRRLHEGKDAGREREPARRSARVAPARRRAYRRPELEVFHSVGEQVPQTHRAHGAQYAVTAATWARAGVRLRSRSWRAPPSLSAPRDRAAQTPAPGATTVFVPPGPADRAAPRTDRNSMVAHEQLLEKARTGRIDVYFVGDSITRRWGATDYPELLAHWRKNFFGWNAGNFGWGADRTEHILWRLENGELDGVNPKVIVIHGGTNNIGARPGDDSKVAEITRGLTAILNICQKKAPGATIILTAIFPRNDNMAVMPEIDRVNANLARLANGRSVRYLNVNDRLADKDGRLFEGVMNDADKLHPTLKGYQVWADGLKPIFLELLGPPAATDLAPPPTGNPNVKGLLPRDRPLGTFLW